MEHSDMWVFKGENAYAVWKQFKPHWEREKGEKHPSLLRPMRRAFFGHFFATMVMQFWYSA
jgi:hypothetical protein